MLQVARQFALGARPGDIDTVEWLERAAHEALALDAGIAADFFEQALALAPEAWAGRARIQTALLEPLAWSGRIEVARSLAEDLVRRRRRAVRRRGRHLCRCGCEPRSGAR